MFNRKMVFALVLATFFVASIGEAAAPPQRQTNSQAPKFRVGLGFGTSLDVFAGNAGGSVGTLVARAEVAERIVANGSLGIETQGGDFQQGNTFGLGLSAQFRALSNDAKTLHFHVIGGLSYVRRGEEITIQNPDPQARPQQIDVDAAASRIGLFGGVGFEYFFPGAGNQLSMQMDAGPRIDLLSYDADVTGFDAQSGNNLSLFSPNFMGGMMFTYYFTGM